MTEIEILRDKINSIDAQMAALFEERMQVSRAIAAYKEKNGLPTFDPAREKQNIERSTAYVSPELASLYAEFLQKNMDLSKAYQNELRKK